MFKTLKEITEAEAKKIFKTHKEGYWLDAGGHNMGIDNETEPYLYGDFIYTFRGRDWGVRKNNFGGHVTYEKGPMQY